MVISGALRTNLPSFIKPQRCLFQGLAWSVHIIINTVAQRAANSPPKIRLMLQKPLIGVPQATFQINAVFPPQGLET